MKEFSEEQSVIRKYLLGNLPDQVKMRQIEEKSLLDELFDEELLIAEDELIEDYLDGTLTGEEREQFTRFFLLVPERREKLQLIQNLRKYAANADVQTVRQFSKEKSRAFDWRSFFSPAIVRFALIFLVVGGLGFGIWRTVFYQSDVDKGLAQLRLAYRGQRPVESRTTAEFDYAPLIITRGNEQPAADEKSLARAERFLLDATENAANAEAHHALGLLYLTQKQPDKALQEFNQALDSAPNNAKLHSDTGAAYLEKAIRAEAEEKGDEFFENADSALKHLNRALELNENLSEALFNKALVLQKMRLTNEAQKMWQQYLEKDSVSPWADEARKNLELLQRQNSAPKDKSQILHDFLDAFRRRDDTRAWEIVSQTKELITGVMIQPQLARKFLEANQQSRKEEADEILSAFVYLGELENQNAKDLYFSELANFYANTNQTQRQKLLEAHNELQKGYDLILKPDFNQALETLKHAGDSFSFAENTWETKIVEFQIGYCLTQLNKITESNNLLFSIAENSEKKGYKWLQVLANGWIGNNYMVLGEHSRAISYNQKALDAAKEISDTYNIQKTLNIFANKYWLVNDSSKTLGSLYQGFVLTGSYFLSPRQKIRNLIFAVESLYRFEFYDAAVAFGHEEAIVAENELKDNWLSHTAHSHLAMIYSGERDFAKAFREIDTGFRLISAFSDESMRQKLAAKTRLIQANLQNKSGDCASAILNYNQVIQDYEKTEFSLYNYAARKGRLLCYVTQRDDSAFREEMPALLKLFDENRQTIVEETARNIFFDNEQSVYDIAADYAYTELKDTELAFNYTENSRARSLLGLINNNQSQPFSLSEIRQKMPPESQIIYYAILADKLLIWQITEKEYLVVEKPIKSEELSDKIEKYAKLLTGKNDEEEISKAAKELYEILIKPIETTLEPDKSLAIVVDKVLLRLPFASLISPKTDQYLIEDYTLLYAPSATVFINKTEIAKQKESTQDEIILSIGNPAFSRQEYPGLADLPSAKSEAEEIASFYQSPKVFLGKEAVKEQFVNNLDEADIVHFAGHYVANEKSPAHSKFLLASGDLPVGEITRKKLPRVRLMILSACETGVEKFYNGEGMIGAARAFLAADVPLVVASGWSVDSDATDELMVNFHRYRKQNDMSSMAALRQAQIAMLKGENRRFRQPFYWAGFLPIGGYADY